jgi:hypothetical protein
MLIVSIVIFANENGAGTRKVGYDTFDIALLAAAVVDLYINVSPNRCKGACKNGDSNKSKSNFPLQINSTSTPPMPLSTRIWICGPPSPRCV